MRKETDDFMCRAGVELEDFINASCSNDGSVNFKTVESDLSSQVILTKQQARKFAKQILEMTGDEDE